MISFAFIITSVKFQLELIRAKFFPPHDFLQWTLYNTIYSMAPPQNINFLYYLISYLHYYLIANTI